MPIYQSEDHLNRIKVNHLFLLWVLLLGLLCPFLLRLVSIFHLGHCKGLRTVSRKRERQWVEAIGGVVLPTDRFTAYTCVEICSFLCCDQVESPLETFCTMLTSLLCEYCHKHVMYSTSACVANVNEYFTFLSCMCNV